MKQILIVDDCARIRQLVITTLTTRNFTIFEASDGVSAVKMAQELIPDLIIMDIIMPGMIDGIEATRQIKSNRKTAQCTIIILTGSKDARREECLAAGATEIFMKPFSPLDLIKKVEQTLETSL